MRVIEVIVTAMLIFTLVYMIIKSIAVFGDKIYINTNEDECDGEIEITSRDLYIEAENLLATVDVYNAQSYELMKQIAEIDKQIMHAKSCKVTSNERDITKMRVQSYKLQEQKCKLDAKVIKLNRQLDKIAREEYERSRH